MVVDQDVVPADLPTSPPIEAGSCFLPISTSKVPYKLDTDDIAS